MIPRVRHVTLTRFLLLSCGLHFLMLLGHDRANETSTLHPLGQQTLSVELEDPARMPHVARKTSVTSRYTTQRAPGAAMIPPTTRESNPGKSPSAVPLHDASSRTESETVAASGDALRNQLLGDLQTRLAHYLTYPPLARARGWQGTVWLGLHVESDGRLESIRLERSSGYAVLDRSALNSLNRLGYLTEAVAWLNGRSIDMQLPVIYRLVEN